MVLVEVSPFSFFIWILSLLLLGKPGQRFVSFVSNQLLVLVIFFLFLKNLYFVCFLPDGYYFLPSADFSFCLSFFF